MIGLDAIPSYPIKREEVLAVLPVVADDAVWKVVKSAIDDEADENHDRNPAAKVEDIRKTGRKAAVDVINFYFDAHNDFPTIEKFGIVEYATTYRSGKVIVVLLRAKLEGKTFPL
jgi:hypothetical protein